MRVGEGVKVDFIRRFYYGCTGRKDITEGRPNVVPDDSEGESAWS